MGALRYIRPIWLVPTYIQYAAIRSMCIKIYQNTFRTERQVYVVTDEHINSQTDGQD